MNTLRLCTTALFLASSGAAFGMASQNFNRDCHTNDIPLATTNWSNSVSIPKFDTNLGILLSIDFRLTGGIFGSAAVESLDAQPSVVTTNYQAAITLTRPDLSVIVVAVPNQNFMDPLTAFDGVIDFGGTSGASHPGISTNATVSISSNAPADLALFTGAGNIVLPVTAVGSSTASGSGNVITQFATNAEASVKVCYYYAKDCNGNGVPDSLDLTNQTSNDYNSDGTPDECQPRTRSFCEGDGSTVNGGLDCPCNNNGNPGEGCDWGMGSGALLTATGIPSVSNDTLSLTASQLPVSHGFFLVGDLTAGGMDGQPLANGIGCITNIVRLDKFVNGGTIPLMNQAPLSVQLSAAPGDTMNFQYWFRNPMGLCQPGVNSTNAIEVTWGL